MDAAARLIRVARQAGARVALDVSGEALRLGLAAGPDFVKVNASEAAELGFGTAANLREAAAQGLAAADSGPRRDEENPGSAGQGAAPR